MVGVISQLQHSRTVVVSEVMEAIKVEEIKNEWKIPFKQTGVRVSKCGMENSYNFYLLYFEGFPRREHDQRCHQTRQLVSWQKLLR